MLSKERRRNKQKKWKKKRRTRRKAKKKKQKKRRRRRWRRKREKGERRERERERQTCGESGKPRGIKGPSGYIVNLLRFAVRSLIVSAWGPDCADHFFRHGFQQGSRESDKVSASSCEVGRNSEPVQVSALEPMNEGRGTDPKNLRT